VTLEACKRIATSRLLCTMPGIEVIKAMKSTMKKVEAKSVATHVGATIDNIHPYGYETNQVSAYISTERQWSYPSFALDLLV